MELIELSKGSTYSQWLVEVEDLLLAIEDIQLNVSSTSLYERELIKFIEVARSSNLAIIQVPESLVCNGTSGRYLAITELLDLNEIVEIVSTVGIRYCEGELPYSIERELRTYVTQKSVETFVYVNSYYLQNFGYFRVESQKLRDSFEYVVGASGVGIVEDNGECKLSYCSQCLIVGWFDGISPSYQGTITLDSSSLECITCHASDEFKNVDTCPKCNIDTLVVDMDNEEFYCLNLRHGASYSVEELEELGYEFDGQNVNYVGED